MMATGADGALMSVRPPYPKGAEYRRRLCRGNRGRLDSANHCAFLCLPRSPRTEPMKITGARNEPFSAMRRRALIQAGAQLPSAGPVDCTEFLGIGEMEMTPAVKAAIQALLSEIDDLRGEVGRLKGRLGEVEDLADRDALTPLLNRRAFVRELGRIKTFAQRYGSPASLVYIDLDDLKGVNDRLGHAAGDAALNAVAERL